MRKLVFAVIIMLAAAFFAACGRNGEQGAEQEQDRAGRLPFAPATDGFVFVHNGVEVIMGTPVDGNILTAEFGEPLGILHEPSCAFDGYDLTFTFNDFIVNTFPYGDIYFVNIINFRNDNVATREGLRIGMTYDDMVRLYGDGYYAQRGMNSMFTFERGGMRLAIMVNSDNEIIQITYHLNL